MTSTDTRKIEPLVDQSDSKVNKLLNQIRELAPTSKIAVFTGFVDPDGLASGYAMEAILQKAGLPCTVFYKGTFNRPQNKMFKALLNLSSQPEEKYKEEEFTHLIAVDCTASLCPATPDFIIDHHEPSGQAKIASDIRMVGSTSSIMWEYCTAAGVNFADEQGQKLATALLVGIITDTKNGIVDTANELDYQAMAYFHKYKDNKLYKDIIDYPKPHYYNDLFCSAWANKTIEGTFLISGVGPIPEARSGILSDLAEKFVEMEGVNTAVLFGIVDHRIEISVRSNAKINVDDFVKNAFGSGGGKPGAGRSKIELPILFQNISDTLSEELFETCFKIVKHKVLQIAGDKK